jgi:hypothetical protein
MKTIMRLAMGFILMAALVYAEEPENKTLFYVFTGMSKPAKPDAFQTSWASGFNVGVGMGYAVSKHFEVDGLLTYNNIPFDQSGFEGTLTKGLDSVRVDGDAGHIITLAARAKLIGPPTANGKAAIYGFLDAGWLYRRQKSVSVTMLYNLPASYTTLGVDESAACVGLGIGADLLLDPTTQFFVEAEVVGGFTRHETTVYVPLKFGMRIRF